MQDEEWYEQYVNFIEDVLYNLTSISDYISILESLGIPYKNGRVKGGCHNDIDELGNAGYHVQFDEVERKFYCQVCKVGYNLLTFLEQIFKVRGEDKSRNECLKYICNKLDIPFNFKSTESKPKLEYNWKKSLLKYLPKQSKVEELTVYDDSILNLLEPIYHQSFIDDNISIPTMEKYGLKYYRYAQQVAIPIYDDMDRFVGIHSRNFRPEMIELGYKYVPLRTINSTEYRFPTSLVLYGLNMNKENVKRTKSIMLFESQKSVMQMEEILDVNISVGMFGTCLKRPQRNLILKYEVNTVYICLDKQYKMMYDRDGIKTDEFIKYEKMVMDIYNELKNFVPNIYVVYDDGDVLGYKDSPSDKGKVVWDKLLERREKL